MKEIKIRQNEPDMLKLQFLQRKMYDCSKKYWRISWCVTGILLTCTMIAKIFKQDSSAVYSTMLAVLNIMIFSFEYLSDRKQKIGATAKYYIDSSLFGFSDSDAKFSKNEIQEIAIACKGKNAFEFEIQTKNTGNDNPPGLRDWYSAGKDGDFNAIVFGCQKENVWYQRKLSTAYLYFLLLVISLILIGGIILLVILDITFIDIFLFLLANLGFVSKIGKDILAMYMYNVMQIRIHENIVMIENVDKLKMPLLQQLQDNINSLREVKFLVPDFLHKRNARKLHALYSDINGT